MFFSDQVKMIVSSSDPIAPVGYLKVEQAHLEPKRPSLCMFPLRHQLSFSLALFLCRIFEWQHMQDLFSIFLFCVTVMLWNKMHRIYLAPKDQRNCTNVTISSHYHRSTLSIRWWTGIYLNITVRPPREEKFLFPVGESTAIRLAMSACW